MKRIAWALLCGGLFGAGLIVSDMVNPARVLAFLDVAGRWDPTLAYVMAAALVPSALAVAFDRRMQHPVSAAAFDSPRRASIDAKLIGGAALFGVGWGLVGLCPGPALSLLMSGSIQPVVFVLAMLAGMAAHAATLGGPRPAGSSA